MTDPTGTPRANIDVAAAAIEPKRMHTDPGIALLSALTAAVAVGLCVFFWIATAWAEGAATAALAAVGCTLFSTFDDPTKIIRNFAIVLALCVPIVIVYQFFILPAISSAELLCIVLAFVLLPVGFLLAVPAYAPVGLALALGFCLEIGLQTSYTADLVTILNTNSALVLGAFAALVVTGLMRAIGTETSARRLIRATYRDLADLADRHALPTRNQWASRMLDRVALLLYRQPRGELRPQHEFVDALENLRLGINIIEIQSIAPGMSETAQQALAAMFGELAPLFRGLARGRVPLLGDGVLHKIDTAITEVTACAPVGRAGVAAIVGLRRTLCPDALPYRPMQMAPSASHSAPREVASVN